mgnify:CR=1 FL=1
MQIEHGKLYLTKDDYIVEIVSDRDGLFATQRTSPGTLDKCTIIEYCKTFRMDWAKKHGWLYNRSGKLSQSYHSLYSELEIVAEYPYKLVDPPEGFAWKGGFPKLHDVQKGDEYIAYEVMNNLLQHASSPHHGVTLTRRDVIGSKRIVLERMATKQPEPIVGSPPQEQYYISNRRSIFASGIYWVKKSGVWHFTNQHVADVVDKSNDELFQRGINNKDLILCSKEEALAHFEKATKKEDVVASPPKEQETITTSSDNQYYLPKSTCAYLNHRKYYVKKKDGKWYSCLTGAEEPEGGTPAKFWAQEIGNLNLIACSKEQALAKIEKSEQYYVPTDMYDGGQNKYFVRRGDVWAKWDLFSRKEIVDTSGESFWVGFIADGKIKPSTKEEALIRVAITKQEVAVSAPQESWPKYYVHTNEPKGWGVVRNKDGQCDFIKMRECIEHGPFVWSYDGFVKAGTYKEVTKEELIARFDEDPFSSQKIETKSLKIGEVPPKPVTASTPTITGPVTPTKSTVSLPVSSPKEEKMNKNTFVSVIKSVGGSALRATKHLYIEPAVIVGGHIKRSLRYVVFFGTIAGAIYGANNPEKLKKNVMAYMPKVTIEAPEILK